LDPGHGADEIWVSVKDGEMNLIQALSSTNKLCPNPSKPITYTSSPTDKTKPYHYATEIQLSSGKTFQEAINDGDFCCVPETCSSLGYECGTWDDGCGGTLNCGTCGANEECSNGKCVSTCVSNMGDSCYPSGVDASCTNPGTIDCSGDCTGYSYKPKGTNCGSEYYKSLFPYEKACDGAGNCLGWAGGRGCGDCPWGSFDTAEGVTTIKYCHLNGNQGRYMKQYDGRIWSGWSYQESRGALCENKYCCIWQIICLTPRCGNEYYWNIKP